MRIIERVAGHYEARDAAGFNRVYRWHPQSVVTECECGRRASFRRLDLIGSVAACECGADTARIREELVIELLEEDEPTYRP